MLTRDFDNGKAEQLPESSITPPHPVENTTAFHSQAFIPCNLNSPCLIERLIAPVFKDDSSNITLIGAGTIGLSFVALHLQYFASPSQLTIHDTRPNLQSYIRTNLPKYLPESQHALVSQINLSNSANTYQTLSQGRQWCRNKDLRT